MMYKLERLKVLVQLRLQYLWHRRKLSSSTGRSQLPIVHHDEYVTDLPPNHRFPMQKFHGVLKHLLRDNIISHDQVWSAPKATVDQLCSVHSKEYIEKFFRGETTDKEQRRSGFKWSPGIVNRCRRESGGTILTTELALERGLACSTAGGTHHAFPTYASGYCLLNDLAVAATWALDSGQAARVLIVDLDAHQGDGTAYIFGAEDRVMTWSVHCRSNFPFRKQDSDLDTGLEDGTQDEAYLATIRRYLPHLLTSLGPDLVLYDAGVDPHAADDLGRLGLTDRGLFARDYYVINETLARGIPCACVIGGGYSRDIDELAVRHTILHRAASKVWRERGL